MGVQVTGTLTTTAPSDTFATHDSVLGLGGHHEVANKAARNAITADRRRHGMFVYTQDTGEIWVLTSPVSTGTDEDWTLLGTGSTVPESSQEFPFPTPETTWVMEHTLGGYPSVTLKDLNGVEFEGGVEYVSTSRVEVTFLVPGGMAGSATLRNKG